MAIQIGTTFPRYTTSVPPRRRHQQAVARAPNPRTDPSVSEAHACISILIKPGLEDSTGPKPSRSGHPYVIGSLARRTSPGRRPAAVRHFILSSYLPARFCLRNPPPSKGLPATNCPVPHVVLLNSAILRHGNT